MSSRFPNNPRKDDKEEVGQASGSSMWRGRRISVSASQRPQSLSPGFSLPSLPLPDPLVGIQMTMRECGVREKLHSEFWNDHVDFVRKIVSGEMVTEDSLENDVPEVLPSDLKDAVSKVVEKELRSLDEDMWVETDKIKEDFPDHLSHSIAGFHYDRYRRRYVIHRMFLELGIDRALLDPFVRFTYERLPTSSVLANQFWENNQDTLTACFRAIVAHNACHNVEAKCVNCYSNSVAWNGYQDETRYRQWNKLVCSSCNSYYDIRSAATKGNTLSKLSNKKYLGGGPFEKYHQILRKA